MLGVLRSDPVDLPPPLSWVDTRLFLGVKLSSSDTHPKRPGPSPRWNPSHPLSRSGFDRTRISFRKGKGVGPRGTDRRRGADPTREMWRRRALECACAMRNGSWKDVVEVKEGNRGFAKKATPAKASKGTGKGKADASKKQPKKKVDETVGKELQFVLDAFVPQPREKHSMDEETLKRKEAEAKAYSKKKVRSERETHPISNDRWLTLVSDVMHHERSCDARLLSWTIPSLDLPQRWCRCLSTGNGRGT